MFLHPCLVWGNDQQICHSKGNNPKCYRTTYYSLHILLWRPDALQSNVAKVFFFFWFITLQWSTYQSTHIMYIILIKEWVFSLHTSQYFTAKNVQVPRFLIFDQRIWFSPLKKQYMSYGIFTFYQKQKKKCLAVRCSNSLLVEDEIGGKLFWCFYNL